MSQPVVLGIAGCSGSGKTTLAEELARELEGTHFHLDHYYRDLAHMSYEERCLQNFDDPDILESELLIRDVGRMAAGETIWHPQYDFATHTRKKNAITRMEPGHLLIIDGIFALHYPGLRKFYDLGIYVDTPDEVCYERRLRRDVNQRGRTQESVAQHYAETVRPMAEKYVRPSAKHADLVMDGTESLDWSIEGLMNDLRRRGLLKRILGE